MDSAGIGDWETLEWKHHLCWALKNEGTFIIRQLWVEKGKQFLQVEGNI